jgi:hypothetical protein
VDGLRGTLVFVDQAAEQVAAADAIKIDQFGRGSFAPRRRLTERRPLPEGAVRAMFVVVPRVARENALQVAAADDQEPVEAFPTDASDPTLGMRSRLRRPDRRSDDLDPFGAEDVVELTRELAVAITNQEAGTDAFVVELHQQVARLLAHPAAVGVSRDPGQMNAAARQLDEEQHIEALQEQGVDGEEVALEDARRLLAKKLRPARLETLRCRLDARLLENRPDGARGQLDPEADQLAVDPPVAQPGFSSASRTTSSRTPAGVAGRPARRCG